MSGAWFPACRARHFRHLSCPAYCLSCPARHSKASFMSGAWLPARVVSRTSLRHWSCPAYDFWRLLCPAHCLSCPARHSNKCHVRLMVSGKCRVRPVISDTLSCPACCLSCPARHSDAGHIWRMNSGTCLVRRVCSIVYRVRHIISTSVVSDTMFPPYIVSGNIVSNIGRVQCIDGWEGRLSGGDKFPVG